MTEAEMTKLQGRLNAHRELLVELMSRMLADGRKMSGALGAAGDDLPVFDQEEDPGVLPTAAFAEEAEYSDEMRSIWRAAQDRAKARGRAD